MSRDLCTFPFPQHVGFKLIDRSFASADDLKGLKPAELSKETGLTLEEALDVLETVFPPSPPENGTELSTNALQILKDDASLSGITTSCHKLDEILGGGLPLKRVSEICGCPGTGKTQLCLQACVNVQIPKKFNGVEGEALFIDTEGSFSIDRLVQIANSLLSNHEELKKGISLQKLLQGVHYDHCKSYTELIARVNVLNEFLDENPNIALIIIDSICFHFRYGFDGSYSLRTRLLNGLSQSLGKVASKYNVAVIVTNQMTTKFQGDDDSNVVPALGESWGHACAVRVILSWDMQRRKAYLLKSPWKQEDCTYYEISKSGIGDCDPEQCESEEPPSLSSLPDDSNKRQKLE